MAKLMNLGCGCSLTIVVSRDMVFTVFLIGPCITECGPFTIMVTLSSWVSIIDDNIDPYGCSKFVCIYNSRSVVYNVHPKTL